jgi:IPT/TIG domain
VNSKWSAVVVRLAISLVISGVTPVALVAGGPRYVAGMTYFNSAVTGQPVHWAAGVVKYFVDQGPLNTTVSNQQATSMVDAAAALWSAVPTAGVTLVDAGTLGEDVDGATVVAGNAVFAQPSDVTPAALAYPLGIVYDADGSVINALFGAGASDPTACQNTGVWTWLDNINPDATIAHGIILLNGLCATTPSLIQMMSFQLERAFGRALGLDYAQVNPGAQTNGEPDGMLGWPVMQPMSGACGATGGVCIPLPNELRYDDMAALNRMYPITTANLASFPQKELTAANTVSIRGTISFASGTGMQGVNVVARPLDAGGNPMYQYTVTFPSGRYFSGDHGNPVTGWTDANGILLSQWGSNDPSLQGYFDLSGIPLPPGMTTANYQVTFEAINPLYMLAQSVGPYTDGSPNPSGTMPVIAVPGMSAGSSQVLTVSIKDSAMGDSQDAIGSEASPRMLPQSGMWSGRLSEIGQTDWFSFPVRGGRSFTVVTQALNEAGVPTESKALPALGVWDGFDPVGSPAVGFAPALNGNAVGETWLRVTAGSDDVVRLGVTDMRGDGRPDSVYVGWVLYADSVAPARLPASGGPIVIHGMGFRASDTVLVGGQPAVVTSVFPDEITAIVPAAQAGASGSVDVEVDDLPIYYAASVISGGVSYDAGTGDSLTLVSAPMNTVPTGVPLPFTVTALGPDLAPAGGVTVTFTVTSGAAKLGCGLSACSVTATGDGIATMTIAAVNNSIAVVTASLANGASLQAHFAGGTPPTIAALTPTLSIAAGTSVNWTAQALVLNGSGSPMSGQSVVWQMPGSGITAQNGAPVVTNTNGVASMTLTAGPLAEGQQVVANACVNGTPQCASFTVIGARPEYGWLEAVTGTAQTLAASGTPAQITLRLRDMNGNPMAGGTVALYQALYAWAPPCPPHGRCDAPPLLASQVSTATSAIDGSVVFVPASMTGMATNLLGVATTGYASAVNISIEQHP